MINTWNESLLHEELKGRYGKKGDTLEAPVGESICDVLHADGSVTEVQTAHLGKLKGKLERLLTQRKVRLVYPIAQTLRIETLNVDGTPKSSRKSPKKGSIFQIFPELTGIYHLFDTNRLELEVVFTDVTEYRVADGTGSWRRKGVRIDNRKLDEVHSVRQFRSLQDLLELIPQGTPETFTTKDLKERGVGKYAGHMVWVLRKSGLIEKIGTRDRCYLYQIR